MCGGVCGVCGGVLLFGGDLVCGACIVSFDSLFWLGRVSWVFLSLVGLV